MKSNHEHSTLNEFRYKNLGTGSNSTPASSSHGNSPMPYPTTYPYAQPQQN